METILQVDRFDPGIEKHHLLADQAVQWQRHDGGSMFPLTAENMAKHLVGILAYVEDPEPTFLGYNAVTYEYEDGSIEIGALFVPEPLRSHTEKGPAVKPADGRSLVTHIKERLFEEIRIEFPERKILTLVNPLSRPINEKLGFTEVSPTEVDSEVLELCVTENCPDREEKAIRAGRLCCHDVMVSSTRELPILEVVREVPVSINPHSDLRL